MNQQNVAKAGVVQEVEELIAAEMEELERIFAELKSSS